MNENDFTIGTLFMEVVPVRNPSGVWLLYYLEPCLSCGKRHYHGGGNGPEPSLGSRGGHCMLSHKPWRPDCEHQKQKGQHPECHIVHERAHDDVELVLASPEVAEDFRSRLAKGTVNVIRQDRKAAIAHHERLMVEAEARRRR